MKAPIDHLSRFRGFIELIENGADQQTGKAPLIPAAQLHEIKYNPQFNSRLDPEPFDLFYKTFDWYLCLRLIPGGTYGPFYRVDAKHFWPQDSDGINAESESKYFYGLKEPANQREAQEMYNMMPETPRDYVHEFIIDAQTIGDVHDACIFIGPAKGGTGYQFNANTRTATIIRSLIVRGEISVKKLKK